ncbi:cation diffusion facilitator family transporter [Lichenicoccus sp.]|uniref:cation diffusion facilitator family transporter n=1 Tax=Lichenicoccus sp. TaxID=2781899 RepID=UPI003D0D7DDE
MSQVLRLGWASLAVSAVALALKYAAYVATGSVALYSDAIECIINVVAALGGLLALSVSARPADANHPYGHYKAEYLSAVVEGALVLLTAFAIGRQAWFGLQHPHVPTAPAQGIALNAAASALNWVWALVLSRVGRRRRSPALAAAGRHVMSDVWTSAAVLAGFTLVPLTGWLWLDPLLAALIAINILRVGYEMVRSSIGGLMDEVTDPHAVEDIRRVIAENAEGAIEAHDVRTRCVGSMTFVEFHLVVPAQMAVQTAHEICDRIETALRRDLGDALINIHVEPEQKAKREGAVVLP